MVDVPKQVEYWSSSSDEDFAAAQTLLEKGHLRHSLFFAHLAVEKMLKALVTRQTNDIPPRIHNLARLAEMAGLSVDAERGSFLRTFDMHQLQGRYPDSTGLLIDSEAAREKLVSAGDILKWLKAQL